MYFIMKNTVSELQIYRVKEAVKSLKSRFEKGDFPKGKLQVQIMPETDAEKVP